MKGAVYIGETGRQLKIRAEEHRKAWEKGKLGGSAFANHLITSGHKFIKGSEALLHRENSYRKRLALEHIEIIRHLNNDNLNCAQQVYS